MAIYGSLVPSDATGAYSFRNKIINGNFEFWQRGTSFSSPNGYTADRWIVSSDATHTGTQQSFTLGQTSVPGEPKYFLRSSKSSGGSYVNALQRIESVRTLAGKQTTISFWAKGSSSATLNWRLFQYFGTGGSPSAINESQTGTLSLTTSWQKFTINCTPQSISGKTLGSNNNDFLYFEVFVATSSAFDIDLAQVQIEEGNFATPFEQRPYGTELALCQRYYVNLQDQPHSTPAYYGMGAATTAVWLYSQLALPVPMRVTPSPTMTVSSLAGLSSAAAYGRTSTRIEIQGRTSGSTTDAYFYTSVFNVSAEL